MKLGFSIRPSFSLFSRVLLANAAHQINYENIRMRKQKDSGLGAGISLREVENLI